MGLLDGGKQTFVSSVAYNLAGDEELRPQYLRTLVLRNILSDTKNSMGRSITNGYLAGPGIKFRSFFRWAELHYSDIGIPHGTLNAGVSIDLHIAEEFIPHDAGKEVWAQDGSYGVASYAMWIEQYMLLYHPQEIDTDWSANIDQDTNEITITFEGGFHETFMPEDFDKNAYYLYVYYVIITTDEEQPLTEGPDNTTPFPDTTGWILDEEIEEERTMTLVTTIVTVKTYSDATPPETTTDTDSVDETYTYLYQAYHLDTYLGSILDPDDPELQGIKKNRKYLYLYTDKKKVTTVGTPVVTTEVIGGVTVTTTVTTTTDTKVDDNHWNQDEREIYIKVWEPLQVYIYKVGSGIPELDDAIQETVDYDKFFPFIPVRYETKNLGEDHFPDMFALAKRAYRKATGAKLKDLIESIDDNEQIGDIDFAYVVFGVSLNVREKACKEYMYAFFRRMMLDQVGGFDMYADWAAGRDDVHTASEAWIAWKQAQDDPLDPLYGTPEPPTTSVTNPTLTKNEIIITNEGPFPAQYDIRISWAYIVDGAGSGLAKPDAKKDTYWWEYISTDQYDTTIISPDPTIFSKIEYEKVRLYHQVTETEYTYLEIVGLIHRNYVYNGKYVEIWARSAIEDDEETGFIIPLHYETYRAIRLVDATQMATACCFIVFNCYEIVEQKWYETGFFQILAIVAIAILSAVFLPGAGIGLLGSNIALGTSMGFTGVTAAIIGSVTNALAAVALTSIIEKVAVGIFGPEIGAIIAAVVGFVITSAISSSVSGGSFLTNWGELMKVDNIMMLMDATGKGYQAYVSLDIKKMREESEEYADKAKTQEKDIKQTYYEEFGYGIGVINPMDLIESTKLVLESGDTFLTRTLMTGSEIADMSLDMVTDFADLTLTLPNAYV